MRNIVSQMQEISNIAFNTLVGIITLIKENVLKIEKDHHGVKYNHRWFKFEIFYWYYIPLNILHVHYNKFYYTSFYL